VIVKEDRNDLLRFEELLVLGKSLIEQYEYYLMESNDTPVFRRALWRL